MIKIWPIHKHKWVHQSNLNCSCRNHNYNSGVLITCYCGKLKTYKLPQGYCWSDTTVKKMMEVKGWINGEVQYIR